MAEKLSPQDRITNRIIADLEAGVATWKCPWDRLGSGLTLPTRANGEIYQGINVLMLWATAGERGYRAQRWMTYRQAKALGGQVRKGETGTLVVYFGQSSAKGDDDGGDDGEGRSFRFLKGYPVFNVEQIDGLPAEFYPPVVPITQDRIHERRPKIDSFLDATGAVIQWKGDQAFYSPGPDHIRLPELALFKDVEHAYATAMHELVHWTGAKHRLDREFGKRFGDNRYAMEELVAELGAAFLGAHFGLRPDHITNHSQYIGHWLSILKGDNRAIFTAAGQAQKAVDYVLDKVGMKTVVTTDDMEEAA